MNLFRLVLCLVGVALYVIMRGSGSEKTKAGKTAPPPAAQSVKSDQPQDCGASQLTSHINILQPSNALAAGKSAEAGAPSPAR